MEIQPGKDGKYKLRDWAHMAGFPTPTLQDDENTAGASQFRRNTLAHGIPGAPSCAWTENSAEYPGTSIPSSASRFRLNPAFSRALMGYPVEWDQAALMAHRRFQARKRLTPPAKPSRAV